jgi:hypothetical protein
MSIALLHKMFGIKWGSSIDRQGYPPLQMNLLNLFFHREALVYAALNTNGQQMSLARNFHAGDAQQTCFIPALPDHIFTEG